MSRVCLQQGELSIGPVPYLGGQSSVVVPKIRVRPMDHAERRLKQVCSSSLVVAKRTVDAVVQASGSEIVLELCVDPLRVVLIKPQLEFLSL